MCINGLSHLLSRKITIFFLNESNRISHLKREEKKICIKKKIRLKKERKIVPNITLYSLKCDKGFSTELFVYVSPLTEQQRIRASLMLNFNGQLKCNYFDFMCVCG